MSTAVSSQSAHESAKRPKPKTEVIVTMVVVGLMHLACLGIFWVGWSWAAVITCLVLYQIRGFGITGAYHRYFSHRSYTTSRWFQFLLALWGCSAMQGTPLEWSRNHRHHHNHSDKETDIHSPRQGGFLWAHIGWMMSMSGAPVEQRIRDLEKFPELRWTSILQIPVIASVVLFTYWFGEFLGAEYGTSGMQMVVWGFCLSTVILWHVTYSINSLTHMIGRQRYETGDDSRNSFLIAIFALGEGWHNNHHKYPSVARNGFFWWEIDTTYYVLTVMKWLGLVWDLKPPPASAYALAK